MRAAATHLVRWYCALDILYHLRTHLSSMHTIHHLCNSKWASEGRRVHTYTFMSLIFLESFITKTESYTVHTTNGQTSQPSCTLTYSLKERTHNGNGKTVKMLIFSRHNNMLDCSTFSALYKFNLQYELRTWFPVDLLRTHRRRRHHHHYIQMVTYRPYPSSDGHRRQMPCSTSK